MPIRPFIAATLISWTCGLLAALLAHTVGSPLWATTLASYLTSSAVGSLLYLPIIRSRRESRAAHRVQLT